MAVDSKGQQQYDSVLRLKPSFNNYAWGVTGNSSTVAQLLKADGRVVLPSADDGSTTAAVPYSELWLGMHAHGMSEVLLTSAAVSGGEWVTLEDFSTNNKSYFGTVDDDSTTTSSSNSKLTYLFKILAIAKPLSIQSHPDKLTAEQLHKKLPAVFRDPNHKPEVSVALTKFELMCGFKPLQDIIASIESLPALKRMLGGAQDSLTSIKAVMDGLLSYRERCATEHEFNTTFDELLLQPEDTAGQLQTVKLFTRLHEDFPYDMGCLSAFYLNFVVLQPGEAVYIPPNTLHAYVAGDCVECMAASDNVIRGGLTPKRVDIDILQETLDYAAKPVHYLQESPTAYSHVKLYRPPVKDFEIFKIEFPSGSCAAAGLNMCLSPASASVLIVLQGSVRIQEVTTVATGAADTAAAADASSRSTSAGHSFSRGACAFIKCGTTVQIWQQTTEPVLIFGGSTASNAE